MGRCDSTLGHGAGQTLIFRFTQKDPEKPGLFALYFTLKAFLLSGCTLNSHTVRTDAIWRWISEALIDIIS